MSDCGDPAPSNGIATTLSGTTLGEVATVTCSPGYNTSGSSTLTCLEDGWNDTTTCVIQGD